MNEQTLEYFTVVVAVGNHQVRYQDRAILIDGTVYEHNSEAVQDFINAEMVKTIQPGIYSVTLQGSWFQPPCGCGGWGEEFGLDAITSFKLATTDQLLNAGLVVKGWM